MATLSSHARKRARALHAPPELCRWARAMKTTGTPVALFTELDSPRKDESRDQYDDSDVIVALIRDGVVVTVLLSRLKQLLNSPWAQVFAFRYVPERGRPYPVVALHMDLVRRVRSVPLVKGRQILVKCNSVGGIREAVLIHNEIMSANEVRIGQYALVRSPY